MRNQMMRTLAIAVSLIAMTIAAYGGGTVITGPTAIPNNSVTNAKLRDSAALSVIGRSANSSGDPADIAASSDGDVLRRSGTTLGFGTIPISSVTGAVSNSAGANVIAKSDGTNLVASNATDNGTTFAIAEGATVAAVTGQAFNATVNSSGATSNTTGVAGVAQGSINSTSGDKFAFGVLGEALATRSAGSNKVTNAGVYGIASGGTDNYAGYFDTGAFYVTGAATFNSTVSVTSDLVAGGVFALSGDISPSAISGLTNDWDSSGQSTASRIRVNTSGAVDLTGLANGSDGRVLELVNIGAHTVTIYNENTNSTIGNRLILPGAVAWPLTPGSVARFEYDSTSSRWRMIGWASTDMPGITVNGTLGVTATINVTGNLNVGGDTTVGDAAADKLIIGGSSGPIIKSGSGAPETVVTAGVGSLFLRTDGGAGTSLYVKESGSSSTGWTSVGAPAGSNSMSTAAISTVTLQTEGNVDYFASTQGMDTRPIVTPQSQGSLFSRRGAGWILESFKFDKAGNSFTNDTVSITGSGRTNSAGTESFSGTISSNTTCSRMFSLSSPTNGWGFSFRVPATLTSRTLKVYVSQFSNVIDWTAHLTDGSASDSTASTDSGSGASLSKTISVTFKAAHFGTELVFTGFVASRYTSDPGLTFCAATLAE